MHPIIQKTLGGLSRDYYIRQLIFGLFFPAVIIFTRGLGSVGFPMLLMCVVNTLLYPYARFVYESIVGFIFGRNVFVMPAVLLLGLKIITMAICWFMAIIIAPVGLAYLYYYHSKGAAQ